MRRLPLRPARLRSRWATSLFCDLFSVLREGVRAANRPTGKPAEGCATLTSWYPQTRLTRNADLESSLHLVPGFRQVVARVPLSSRVNGTYLVELVALRRVAPRSAAQPSAPVNHFRPLNADGVVAAQLPLPARN